MTIVVSLNDEFAEAEVVDLYRSVVWSAAEKPALLMAGLRGSHTVVTARLDGWLVGLGNAISDGHLVVYYPHLLVHPEFQGQGVGRQMMLAMGERYAAFHQQMLTADGEAIGFYEGLGFKRAGRTQAMWVYAGNDH